VTAPGPRTPGPDEFEYARSYAYALLGDAQDALHGWNLSNGLDTNQAGALIQARRAIKEAKDALNRAAR
jgi:hypothetical protein